MAELDGPGLKSASIKQVAKFTLCTLDTHDQPPLVQQHVSAELKSLVDGSVLQSVVIGQTSSKVQGEATIWEWRPHWEDCHR